jgi:hypothetical protein
MAHNRAALNFAAFMVNSALDMPPFSDPLAKEA